MLPLASVLGSLFTGSGDTWSHLVATGLARYVGNTALLLAGVAIGVISIGVLSAWLVTTYRFPGRDVLEWALMLPLAMPAYVMAYAYTDWLQFTGPLQSALRAATGWQARDYWFPEIRSLWGAAAMLSLALYPYVYLIARTAFLGLSRSAIEAGRLAGLSAWGAFWHVAVPLARPAIAAGAALALMETLADFGTVSYFALEVLTPASSRRECRWATRSRRPSSQPACSASSWWCSPSSARAAAGRRTTPPRCASRLRPSSCGGRRRSPRSPPALHRWRSASFFPLRSSALWRGTSAA